MAEGGFDFMSLLPLILIFVVFYFLLIRPQQKQMKERKQMLSSLSRGDHVITNGGIMGKIIKIEDHDILIVEIAKNIEVKVMRSMVNSLTSKPTIVSQSDKKITKPKKPAASKSKKTASKKK